MNDLLFDIPIYLRSCENYENERQRAENKMKEWKYALGKKIEIKWPPWRYNDIIGYYQIIVNSSADPGGTVNGVRVEKYIASNKRIVRDPNQRKVKIWLIDPWFHKKLSVYYNRGHDLKTILLKVLDDLYKDVTKGKRKARDITLMLNTIKISLNVWISRNIS
jgi:hypothetical protein